MFPFLIESDGVFIGLFQFIQMSLIKKLENHRIIEYTMLHERVPLWRSKIDNLAPVLQSELYSRRNLYFATTSNESFTEDSIKLSFEATEPCFNNIKFEVNIKYNYTCYELVLFSKFEPYDFLSCEFFDAQIVTPTEDYLVVKTLGSILDERYMQYHAQIDSHTSFYFGDNESKHTESNRWLQLTDSLPLVDM